jgi:Resolvase, N terminal domain
MIYGYARVSTDGQSVAAQIKELRAAGAEKIFRETASGAKSDRAQLRRALAVLDADDVLLVTRLDRLARSTRDLLNTLAQIAAKGARFRSLADTWADTTTAHGRHSDGSRRACRVRARLDPYTDGRRPRPRQGAGREARPQTDLDAAPEGGGDPAQGAPQGDNRADCAEL